MEVLTSNKDYGPDIITSKNQRDLFIFGHLEYDRETLKAEYDRDAGSGMDTAVPFNYYPDDNPAENPKFQWRSTGICCLTTG